MNQQTATLSNKILSTLELSNYSSLHEKRGPICPSRLLLVNHHMSIFSTVLKDSVLNQQCFVQLVELFYEYYETIYHNILVQIQSSNSISTTTTTPITTPTPINFQQIDTDDNAIINILFITFLTICTDLPHSDILCSYITAVNQEDIDLIFTNAFQEDTQTTPQPPNNNNDEFIFNNAMDQNNNNNIIIHDNNNNNNNNPPNTNPPNTTRHLLYVNEKTPHPQHNPIQSNFMKFLRTILVISFSTTSFNILETLPMTVLHFFARRCQSIHYPMDYIHQIFQPLFFNSVPNPLPDNERARHSFQMLRGEFVLQQHQDIFTLLSFDTIFIPFLTQQQFPTLLESYSNLRHEQERLKLQNLSFDQISNECQPQIISTSLSLHHIHNQIIGPLTFIRILTRLSHNLYPRLLPESILSYSSLITSINPLLIDTVLQQFQIDQTNSLLARLSPLFHESIDVNHISVRTIEYYLQLAADTLSVQDVVLQRSDGVALEAIINHTLHIKSKQIKMRPSPVKTNDMLEHDDEDHKYQGDEVHQDQQDTNLITTTNHTGPFTIISQLPIIDFYQFYDPIIATLVALFRNDNEHVGLDSPFHTTLQHIQENYHTVHSQSLQQLKELHNIPNTLLLRKMPPKFEHLLIQTQFFIPTQIFSYDTSNADFIRGPRSKFSTTSTPIPSRLSAGFTFFTHFQERFVQPFYTTHTDLLCNVLNPPPIINPIFNTSYINPQTALTLLFNSLHNHIQSSTINSTPTNAPLDSQLLGTKTKTTKIKSRLDQLYPIFFHVILRIHNIVTSSLGPYSQLKPAHTFGQQNYQTTMTPEELNSIDVRYSIVNNVTSALLTMHETSGTFKILDYAFNNGFLDDLHRFLLHFLPIIESTHYLYFPPNYDTLNEQSQYPAVQIYFPLELENRVMKLLLQGNFLHYLLPTVLQHLSPESDGKPYALDIAQTTFSLFSRHFDFCLMNNDNNATHYHTSTTKFDINGHLPTISQSISTIQPLMLNIQDVRRPWYIPYQLPLNIQRDTIHSTSTGEQYEQKLSIQNQDEQYKYYIKLTTDEFKTILLTMFGHPSNYHKYLHILSYTIRLYRYYSIDSQAEQQLSLQNEKVLMNQSQHAIYTSVSLISGSNYKNLLLDQESSSPQGTFSSFISPSTISPPPTSPSTRLVTFRFNFGNTSFGGSKADWLKNLKQETLDMVGDLLELISEFGIYFILFGIDMGLNPQ